MSTKTVAELMRAHRRELTAAELQIMQALLADYPAAGLQSVAGLAQLAGVSAPTVVRLTAKLGFSGHADLQARLRAELSARAAAPADLYPATADPGSPSAALQRCEQHIGRAVIEALHGADERDCDLVVAMLAESPGPILVTGGSISAGLAMYLSTCLQLLRPGVRYVEPQHGPRATALLDVSDKHTVIAFDYRRYERDTIRFGSDAAARGAQLIVFTDTYLTPLAREATALVTSSIDGPGPLACLTPAFAMIDALLVAIAERDPEARRRRLTQLDQLGRDTAG
ncbi:MurR/RpiR family transcriptional regulator [Flexivirga caeni]|uniref:MurR/RpiR family transcriptional regulator n=1 Tax=Flexivirga caeni TaxID=2294115 RepID=A0A3M9MJ78_9MICO|nr:MurR/RpiR family transcriptional regulator [Flexivirga caeni]RNI24718.1 MurR/RpiR family transcriptional regulator [Flexivirga caeni]